MGKRWHLLSFKPKMTITRRPNSLERRLIQTLLSESFPGRDELAIQASTASVKPGDDESILFVVDASLPPAPVLYRVPVDGSAEDVDGVPIHFLLHVVNGRLTEIDVHREDGKLIRRMPNPESLRLVVYPIEG